MRRAPASQQLDQTRAVAPGARDPMAHPGAARVGPPKTLILGASYFRYYLLVVPHPPRSMAYLLSVSAYLLCSLFPPGLFLTVAFHPSFAEYKAIAPHVQWLKATLLTLTVLGVVHAAWGLRSKRTVWLPTLATASNALFLYWFWGSTNYMRFLTGL